MMHMNGQHHADAAESDQRIDDLVASSKNAVDDGEHVREHVITQLETAIEDIRKQGGFFNDLAEKMSDIVESLKASHQTARNPIDETVFPKANNVRKFSRPEHRR